MDVRTHSGNGRVAAVSSAAPHIRLLGGFNILHEGGSLALSRDAQRLVAFLALRRSRMPRSYVAGTVWIESSQAQAFGSLRSALWRLGDAAESLVEADSSTVALSAGVTSDVAVTSAAAARLCDPADPCDDAPFSPDPFVNELLPGWYDEWVLLERERLRQQSLHALEALACRLMDDGVFAAAIEAALAAIALDPLRESAHRCLVRIHLSEGNQSEAIRHFENFARHLRRELGVAPSEHMVKLIR